MKKQWQKPQLIVILRKRPESVAIGCKHPTYEVGPSSLNNSCASVWDDKCFDSSNRS